MANHARTQLGSASRPLRTWRLWVVVAVVIGCGGSARSGEKGALEFHLGLGGCTSVSAANATLAKGGTTELIVDDGSERKRTQLTVESGTPGVIELASETFDLACSGDNCPKTEGRLPLTARNVGSSRIAFSSGAAAIDALELRVSAATSIVLADKDGKVTGVHAKVGTPLVLVATMKAGALTAYAKSPFIWSVDGTSLPPTTEGDSVVSLSPVAAGVSTVTVHFAELSAKLVVTVDPQG